MASVCPRPSQVAQLRPWLSHGVEDEGAVLFLCSREDARVRRQRALGQGTTSPEVAGHNLLVEAQLAGDAVEGLGVQVQDGDRVGESRRSGGPEPPPTGETGGGGAGRLTNRKKRV